MGVVYLGTDLEVLADKLARALDLAARSGDFFVPSAIVVPNRGVGKWLRLWLARQRGVAINLHLEYLEQCLWELLREVDPRTHESAPELLDGDSYRLLVLNILLENREAGLGYWQNFLQGAGDSRLFSRRAWNLADQLADLIRDYEYHRQDALIQHWLKKEQALGVEWANLEQAELAIFLAITREPDGKRALLNRRLGKNFKTLPQYALEVMEHYVLAGLKPPRKLGRTLHLFGLSQISALHATTLRWLGRFFDLHLYHFNSLVGRLPGKPSRQQLQKSIEPFRASETGEGAGLGLLKAWGRAGAESLSIMSDLAQDRQIFEVETLPSPPRETAQREQSLFTATAAGTVLGRLQDQLILGKTTTQRLAQDRSLQIVACPGTIREVETVYQSILANLQENPDLKQTDIAVLATDMERYRPVLQAVFERQPRRLHYSLADFTAAGVSALGQGLLGMLDLALESFNAREVFAVLVNPCFLARLGIEHAQATTWLEWAQTLGVYQSWNRQDKKDRGYADSPLFSWQLGMQRLRLGRVMQVTGHSEPAEAPRFEHVVPFADLHSTNRDELNGFCLAVEGLLPRLMKLRTLRAGAGEWVRVLEELLQDFLAVPEDRPEEEEVRARVVEALGRWPLWDELGAEVPKLSLPLVREMVAGVLEGIEGARGQFAAGGVTLAGLQPLKPLPFRVIYVVGLGEDLFPGSNALSGLDLRGQQRLAGDIRPAEFRRYLFLETLLCARDKIYLLYNNLDTQRDQVLHAGVPLQQLQRYLLDHIIDAEFVPASVPLLPSAEEYCQDTVFPGSDVKVQFDETERLLAWSELERQGRLELSATQQAELAGRRQKRQTDFVLTESLTQSTTVPTVTLRDLRQFLYMPAEAALERHLHLRDEDDIDRGDSEPFFTEKQPAGQLIVQTMQHLVLQSVRGDVEQALAEWPAAFEEFYADWQRRGLVPEQAFGQVDRDAILAELGQRIEGKNGLAAFLRRRRAEDFVGPILIGESTVPIGAKTRFPALPLALTRPLPRLGVQEVRLTGSTLFAWREPKSLELLVLSRWTKVSDKQITYPILDPFLFAMALRAGDQSTTWVGPRDFGVNVAHQGGVSSFMYRGADVTPAAAQAYLAELATDLLDPTCFDHLPFDVILKPDLTDAFGPDEAKAAKVAERYVEDFSTLIDDEFEFSGKASVLVELIEAKVPADAFAKVRRRFRMIDKAFRKG